MLLPLLRLWTGPLPKEELFPDRKINPFLHWIIHPLKRRFAKYYLLLLQRLFGLKVIAITGSAGKTTTKDMLHSILSLQGPTVATRDNITPTYNLPTTILKASPSTRYLILEFGVEYPGDMDFYTWLVNPDIGVITSINLTHTHYLDTLDNVSREKGKLMAHLPPTGFAVYNADDPNIQITTPANTSTFGRKPGSFTQIVSSVITPDFHTLIKLATANKLFSISLPILGHHFTTDAAAAVTVASLLDVHTSAIISGLEKFPPPPHRMQPVITPTGVTIIDDSYNANPLATSSSLAILDELARLTHKTPVVVLGQMNELGRYEQSAHSQIGQQIRDLNIKHLFCTGPATKHVIESAGYGQYFSTTDELDLFLRGFLTPDHLVLAKASRSFHFETLVKSLASAGKSIQV